MAVKESQRASSVQGGVAKSRPKRKIPPISKVRAVLRKSLEENEFKMVAPIATLFKHGELQCDHTSMNLLAECFHRKGDKKNADRCTLLAQQVKDTHLRGETPQISNVSPDVGQTGNVTPPYPQPEPRVQAPMVIVREEEEVKEEALDPIDYVRRLQDIIDAPSLTEESILSYGKEPSYERSQNASQTETTVRVRVLLNPPPRNRDIGQFLIARATARMTRNDINGGHRAFTNAKRRAAGNVIQKLNDICRSIEDAAAERLQRSLDDWLDGIRREEYVDKCYYAFKRAKDVIFSSSHAGLYSARVFLYGSATTGLVLGDSDIDVAVAIPMSTKREDTRSQQVDILTFLQKTVKKSMTEVELIAKAKVPVLRYYDTAAKVDVDVTIANDKSVLLSRLLRTHLDGDVRIWELCMAVKYWARRRRVSGALYKNINPMGWVIMAIYFLQHHVTPRIGRLYRTVGSEAAHAVIERVPWTYPKGRGRSTAKTGELLLQFFRFFGYDFDFATEAISINMQQPEMIRRLTRNKQSGAVFIEQPLDLRANVVDYVSASSIDVVRTELRRAYEVCKTSGKSSDLFTRRQRTQADVLFNEY